MRARAAGRRQSPQGRARDREVLEVGATGTTLGQVILEAGPDGRIETTLDRFTHHVDRFGTVHRGGPFTRGRSEET